MGNIYCFIRKNKMWVEHWYSWQIILIILNAMLGLIAFEWAWAKNKRFRKPIAELDQLLPAFRRFDAHKWHKWMFYPGALTLAIPRLIMSVTIGGIIALGLTLLLLCHPMDKPIKGCRAVMIRWWFKVMTFLFQLIVNFNFVTWKSITLEDVSYYEKWLGPVHE